MTWTVPAQSREPGPEWARTALLGEDHAAPRGARAFTDELLRHASAVAQELDLAATEIVGEADRSPTRTEVVDRTAGILRRCSSRLVDVAQRLESRDVTRPFRVVLMGQTMAGKSTLFEFLTGGDGTRVGNGGQRFSRDVSDRMVVGHDFEIVDTPGVGAMDGEDDFEIAFDEVAEADLILWVAADRATQQQTGRALERLADLGKPIVVALNCMRVIRDEFDVEELLDDPELVFGGDSLGNLAPIRRHLSRGGARYITAIQVHALAAELSSRGEYTEDVRRSLLRCSRVEDLVDELDRQQEKTRESRRIAALAEHFRVEVLEVLSECRAAAETTRDGVRRATDQTQALRARSHGRLLDARAELESGFALELARLERWIEKLDVGEPAKAINKLWDTELDDLNSRLSSRAEGTSARLEQDLRDIEADVHDDWNAVDTAEFREIPGRGALWANRLTKVGSRTAISLGTMIAGAQVGAMIGTAAAPVVGTLIGAVVGGVLGFVADLALGKPLDRLADHLFGNASTNRDRRRTGLQAQLADRLDELRASVEQGRDGIHDGWVRAVDESFAHRESLIRRESDAARLLEEKVIPALDESLTRIDTELAREFLHLAGRGRTADALVRGTRWRGAGLAIELEEDAFLETLLFPVDDRVESIVPTSRLAPPHLVALHILRNSTGAPLFVERYNPGAVSVRLSAPEPGGVEEAWAALAEAHTEITVLVDTHENGAIE